MGKGLVGYFSGRRALVLVSIAAVVGGVFTAVPASAAPASNTRSISSSGTTSFASNLDTTGGVQSPELSPGAGSDAGTAAANPSSVPSLTDRSKSTGKSSEGENAGGSNRDGENLKQLASFDGLNHNAQRFANGGNQFSVEPPDQGLCVGNGYVLETVNDVLAVYNQSGGLLKGPVDLNTFYGYPAAVNRSTFVFGQGVTDPSCYFDKATQRWFHVVLTLEVDPNIGRNQGPNHLDIAVSQSSSPLGTWKIYKLPVQDDGTQGTPNHHCSADPIVRPWRTNLNACIGDYPHIGADANGFYITTNEYSFFGPEYKAAQVYAFSKSALAAGAATVDVTQIDTTNAVQGNQAGFTLWPAVSPNGQFQRANGGTEYFLSSNAADEVNPLLNGTSNHIVLWALANTKSLRTSHPSVELTNSVLGVGRYAVPPMSQQKAGSTPLADCLNDTSLQVTATLKGCWRLVLAAQPAHNQVEGQTIDTNDTRMQQVTYANGMVFGALDTALKVEGKTQAGIEWFAVRPNAGNGGGDNGGGGNGGGDHGDGARVVNQGYLGLANTNLSYPALAVNQAGVGAIAFTLVGPNDYPSAAYASFDAGSGTGAIHVAAAGLGPDDGFTNYHAAFALDRTRWGDYGAAVIDGSNLWMASEYIGQTCTYAQFITPPIGRCGGTRSALANWDTRITGIALGGD